MVGRFSTGGDNEQEDQQDKKKHIFGHQVFTALAARCNGVCLQTMRAATPTDCAKCPMAGSNNSLRNAFRFLFSCSKAVLKIVNEVPYLEYGCKHLNMIIWVPKEMPLKFAGEHQWVIYNEVIAFWIWIYQKRICASAQDHSHHRNEILANRTSEGTFPPGSM